MIRIDKGTQVPAILSKPAQKGPTATRSLMSLYDAGTREFEFDSAIYGHVSVKSELIRLQHGKCCFCESQILHVSAGDVEHFRPKAGFKQTVAQKLQKPGYYWLAYDWANLFLCCEECNRRGKKNLFPLIDPTSRATSHHDDVATERSIFVHPADDDPEALIGFRDQYVFGRDAGNRGSATIRELGLDRPALEERRLDVLSAVRAARNTVIRCRKIIDGSQNVPRDILNDLQAILKDQESVISRHQKPTAAYLGMLKANHLLD